MKYSKSFVLGVFGTLLCCSLETTQGVEIGSIVSSFSSWSGTSRRNLRMGFPNDKDHDDKSDIPGGENDDDDGTSTKKSSTSGGTTSSSSSSTYLEAEQLKTASMGTKTKGTPTSMSSNVVEQDLVDTSSSSTSSSSNTTSTTTKMSFNSTTTMNSTKTQNNMTVTMDDESESASASEEGDDDLYYGGHGEYLDDYIASDVNKHRDDDMVDWDLIMEEKKNGTYHTSKIDPTDNFLDQHPHKVFMALVATGVVLVAARFIQNCLTYRKSQYEQLR